MKILLTFFTFLFIGSFNHAFAQNKVTVSQQGSGNTATVTQSGDTKSQANAASEAECDQTGLQPVGNENQIALMKTGSANDTLLYSADRKFNILTDLLYTADLTAYQYGTGNLTKITLPDTSNRSANRLATEQRGSKNSIEAQLGDEPTTISISQKGNENRVEINPCKQ